MATVEALSTKQSARDEWALPTGAMCGAALGALAGVSTAGDLFGGGYANAVLGTLGTILGSVTCALAARFAILPAWSAMHRGSRANRV